MEHFPLSIQRNVEFKAHKNVVRSSS